MPAVTRRADVCVHPSFPHLLRETDRLPLRGETELSGGVAPPTLSEIARHLNHPPAGAGPHKRNVILLNLAQTQAANPAHRDSRANTAVPRTGDVIDSPSARARRSTEHRRASADNRRRQLMHRQRERLRLVAVTAADAWVQDRRAASRILRAQPAQLADQRGVIRQRQGAVIKRERRFEKIAVLVCGVIVLIRTCKP